MTPQDPAPPCGDEMAFALIDLLDCYTIEGKDVTQRLPGIMAQTPEALSRMPDHLLKGENYGPYRDTGSNGASQFLHYHPTRGP